MRGTLPLFLEKRVHSSLLSEFFVLIGDCFGLFLVSY